MHHKYKNFGAYTRFGDSIDLCSEVSCLYIDNTKIINLPESSKGDSFFVLPVSLFGVTRPGREANPRCFSWIRAYEKRMICCTSILKVRIILLSSVVFIVYLWRKLFRCVFYLSSICFSLSREDEQINRLFGFVHHHKDIPFHLAFCQATRAKGHQSAGAARRLRAHIYARASGSFCF